MKKAGCLLIWGLALAASTASIIGATANADEVGSPSIQVGDSWTYRQTEEITPNRFSESEDEYSIERVTSTSIYFNTRPAHGDRTPHEHVAPLDWSRVRDVNGKQTLVNQPLNYPLASGKSWKVEYTEEHPNRQHRSESWSLTYRVVGNELITVQAGQFNAIKVECEGTWTAVMEPGQAVAQGAVNTQAATTLSTQVVRVDAVPASGRIYKAFWYAPEVKRWVKSVEENYSSGGERNERRSSELESYKVN